MNSPSLPESIEPRIKGFFEYRAAQKEALELEEFSFWLRADCLSSNWRLESFYKTLISPISNDSNIYMTLESLAGLLEQETSLVMKCFDRLIECVSSHKSPFIKEDCAEKILKKGFCHSDSEIKSHAENSLETLLKMGYHSFLDLLEDGAES